MPKELITRRNLPHWYVPGAMHFVTFRLAGSLPQQVLDELQAQKARLLNRQIAGETAAARQKRAHKQLFVVNPVKAKLAARPHEYFWCSAHDRFLQDGDTSGWLGLGE